MAEKNNKLVIVDGALNESHDARKTTVNYCTLLYIIV